MFADIFDYVYTYGFGYILILECKKNNENSVKLLMLLIVSLCQRTAKDNWINWWNSLENVSTVL